MAKLLENTFRMINIGLVNEMAVMCERLGVDVWEVIDAAATKPFGFMKFTPGPGLGGHCIPIDPLYLSWKMKGLQLQRPLHRAGLRDQHQHAASCRAARDGGANDRGLALKGSRCWCWAWPTNPTSTMCASRRPWMSSRCCGARARRWNITTRYIPHIHHEYEGWKMDSVTDVMASVRAAGCGGHHHRPQGLRLPAIIEAAKFVFDSRNALGKLNRENPKVVRL